jgi:outer membrane autotransporter protein
LPSADRGLPRLHLAAGGRLWQRLQWSVVTDSLPRRHGTAFDVGLGVDYRLSPALALYGGYRWSDTLSEDDGAAARGVAAHVGVRLRF